MIRSHPPPLLHASELFKFGCLDLARRSPGHLDAGADDAHSTHSGASIDDQESVASSGEFGSDQRSCFDENEDRPLNLSCKRKLTDSDSQHSNPDNHSHHQHPSQQQRLAPTLAEKLGVPAFARPPPLTAGFLPKDVVERAMLHYRAQVLASNDFVRAYLHQKWNESVASGSPGLVTQPPPPPFAATPRLHPALDKARSWVPMVGGVRRLEPTAAVQSPPSTGGFQLLSSPCQSKSCEDVNRSSVIVRRNSPITPPTSPHAPSPPTHILPSPFGAHHHRQHFPSPHHHIHERFSPSSAPGDFPHSPPNATPSASAAAAAATPAVSLSGNKRRRGKRASQTNASGDSFPCTVCGASYPHKFELNRHVKVSHVRPHRCGQCGKGFGHRNYLKVHIETVHMGRKTHQCRLCGKYLSTGGNLNVHVRTIHLGEKKYNCPVCSRSFGQQCNMKTHMKRHFSKSEEI